MNMIDAYCHIGLPRFGTAEDAVAVADLWHIEKSVFVLGPGVPDYARLWDALDAYGDRVRGVGIPFGETAAQVIETVTLQLHAGVLGLRVEARTWQRVPGLLEPLGEQGRWLYAIGALASPAFIRAQLDWLARYPEAKIAAPHFLKPHPLFDDAVDAGLVRNLLSHPRFHAIFSRHGGMGSQRPYPHADFGLWVAQVVEIMGWERIMWGSEYPVCYWRDETLDTCRDWLHALRPDLDAPTLAAFLGGNAQRLMFDAPAPPRARVTTPAWVQAQFNRDRTVPLFPGGWDVPMGLYAHLHHTYVAALQADKDLTFARFILELVGSYTTPG